jgi:aspartate carbamoyltransferase catalytic subunit
MIRFIVRSCTSGLEQSSGAPAICWASKGFPRADITGLLDLAEEFVELNRQVEKKRTSCAAARRSTCSSSLDPHAVLVRDRRQAARRRRHEYVGASSSIRKGETLIDTAVTLNAMHPDILVVRHHASGAVELLAQKVDGSVINAGDGAHEHPTQALLDALTIRRNKGRLEGLTVAICGDICIRASRAPTSFC